MLQRMRRFQPFKEQIPGRVISLGASKQLQDRMSQSQRDAKANPISSMYSEALATSFAFRSAQTTKPSKEECHV